MKTAMQELINRLEEHLVQSAKGQLLTKRGGDYRIGLRKAIDFANEELEKEKEQMFYWFYGGGGLSATDDFRKEFEKNYNQTYNQNKSFTYCHRQIEGQSICDKQCEHCKEYYAPLENQNK